MDIPAKISSLPAALISMLPFRFFCFSDMAEIISHYKEKKTEMFTSPYGVRTRKRTVPFRKHPSLFTHAGKGKQNR
jgi:hypothetical protein